MNIACEKIHAFADGELGRDDADAFRDHLASCRACPGTLEEILVLDDLAAQALASGPLRTLELPTLIPSVSTAVPMAPATDGTREATKPRSRKLTEIIRDFLDGWFRASRLLPVVSAAMIALFAGIRMMPAPQQFASLERPECRSIRGRIAYGDLAQPKPCPVLRAGGGTTTGPLTRQAVLAGLEAKQDRHGLAMANLRDGDLETAAELLALAGDSPAVLNDRAVVALERGDASAALALSEAVLARLPGASFASWNRAVALAELDRRTEAADAFSAIAATGEPGWAAEARARAEALRVEPSR